MQALGSSNSLSNISIRDIEQRIRYGKRLDLTFATYPIAEVRSQKSEVRSQK